LGLALNHWFGVDREMVDMVVGIIDKLHNASLIIDDIQDDSELRRGENVFGVPRSINAAKSAMSFSMCSKQFYNLGIKRQLKYI